MSVTNAELAGDRLDLAPAGGVQLGLPLQRVVLVVLDPDQGRGELVGAVIRRGLFLGGLVVGPDDQRRSCLVDQDAVRFVHDRVVVGALHRLLAIDVSPRPRIDLLEGLAMPSPPSLSRLSSSRRKSKPSSLAVP